MSTLPANKKQLHPRPRRPPTTFFRERGLKNRYFTSSFPLGRLSLGPGEGNQSTTQITTTTAVTLSSSRVRACLSVVASSSWTRWSRSAGERPSLARSLAQALNPPSSSLAPTIRDPSLSSRRRIPRSLLAPSKPFTGRRRRRRHFCAWNYPLFFSSTDDCDRTPTSERSRFCLLFSCPFPTKATRAPLIHPSASVRYSNRRRTLPHSREIYPLLKDRSTVLKQADFNLR